MMDEQRWKVASTSGQPAGWEKDVVPTTWTDEDGDALAQYVVDTEFLHLDDVDELE